MLGTLGNIVFEVAEGNVKTFRDLSFTHSANYTEHKILGRNGLVEFTGLNASSCTFKMVLDASLGVNPEQELEGLAELLNGHEAAEFVLDGQPVGTGQWVIESMNVTADIVDNQGGIVRASVSVTLKEYHEEDEA